MRLKALKGRVFSMEIFDSRCQASVAFSICKDVIYS